MIKEKLTFWPVVSAKIGICLARHLPFSAIFYTILSLVVAVIAVFCAYKQAFLLAILLFLFANFLDTSTKSPENKEETFEPKIEEID